MAFKLQVLIEPKDAIRCGDCRFLVSFGGTGWPGPSGHCSLFNTYVGTLTIAKRADLCIEAEKAALLTYGS
jgi:hypothetical protein